MAQTKVDITDMKQRLDLVIMQTERPPLIENSLEVDFPLQTLADLEKLEALIETESAKEDFVSIHNYFFTKSVFHYLLCIIQNLYIHS